MTALSIQNFAGMLPIREPSLLADNDAQTCTNAFLYKGSLRGFRKGLSVYTLKTGVAQSVYRIPLNANVKQNFATSLWLELPDQFTTVLRAPMIADRFQRYYFFPPGGSPYFNTLPGLQNLAPYTGQPSSNNPGGWSLGVPNPTVAPTVIPAVGTDQLRSYIYTWVNGFGEESPPSPPVVSTIGSATGTWSIGITAPTAAQQANHNIAQVNLYRNVGLTYYRIGSYALNAVFVQDNLVDANVATGVVLPSTTWFPPPADIQGVVMMANGIMAGFSNKKEVWFSEAYTPHAWPAQYAVTVPFPIVGLAAVGTNLLILTEGQPWYAGGVSPGTMAIGAIAANEPCISRGSIFAAGEGVYYASPNGLILVNTSGTTNTSETLMSKEDWIKTDPYDYCASRYASAYFAIVKGGPANANGYIYDHTTFVEQSFTPSKGNTPMSALALPGPPINVYNDELSGQVFLVTGTDVQQWLPEVDTGPLPYIWRSKDFRFPYPEQFAVGAVDFNIPPSVTIPTPTTHNLNQLQTYDPTQQYLLLRVFADGRQVLVREIISSGELCMLPAGYKASYWSFQFEGQVEIKFAQFATSVKELRKV